MGTQESAPQPESNAAGIEISYRGASAKAPAEGLQEKLLEGELPVAPLKETGQGEARLGAAEIAVTLVLAPLAHAAAKAVALTALGYLEDYLRERVQKREDVDVNMQVVVKPPDNPRGSRHPLRLKTATAETLKIFFEQVRQVVNKW